MFPIVKTSCLLAVLVVVALFAQACDNAAGPTAPTPPPAGASSAPAGSGEAQTGSHIDVEKATNGQDADQAPGPEIPVGDPVTWTYGVTNVAGAPQSPASPGCGAPLAHLESFARFPAGRGSSADRVSGWANRRP